MQCLSVLSVEEVSCGNVDTIVVPLFSLEVPEGAVNEFC